MGVFISLVRQVTFMDVRCCYYTGQGKNIQQFQGDGDTECREE